MELRIHSLKVVQIPSKMDDGFSKRKQKPCKGCRFYAWPMLRTCKNSGTVIHDVTKCAEIPQRNDLNGCVLLIFGMGTFESINEDHVHRTIPCFTLLEAGICLGNPVLQPENKSKTKICGNPMTLHFIFKRVQQAHFLGCFKQLTRVEPAKCRATLFHICP